MKEKCQFEMVECWGCVEKDDRLYSSCRLQAAISGSWQKNSGPWMLQHFMFNKRRGFLTLKVCLMDVGQQECDWLSLLFLSCNQSGPWTPHQTTCRSFQGFMIFNEVISFPFLEVISFSGGLFERKRSWGRKQETYSPFHNRILSLLNAAPVISLQLMKNRNRSVI